MPQEFTVLQPLSSLCRYNLSYEGATRLKSDFVTVKEIRRRLDLSHTHAYELLYDGKIPYYRFGKSIRVKRSDFEEYIERHRVRRRV